MQEDFQIIEEGGYLHFRIRGENSVATVQGYLAKIHATCAQRNCATILIEENLCGPGLPIGDVFRIASVGSAATAPVIQRIAYVDTNPEHPPANMAFAENVAVTRGINIRVFADVAAAAAWLHATGGHS